MKLHLYRWWENGLVCKISRTKIHQNFLAVKHDINQHSAFTFKAIEKYRYGLWKTVSKHLKSLLLLFGRISLAKRGSIVEKWSLKAVESSLELEIMEPFNSKFLNGLPCFSRITFRLTKSITIIRCFRSLDVIVYCISQLVFWPVAWIIRFHSFSFGSITMALTFL